MSTENAQKFLDAVNANAGLKTTVLGITANAQAWVASAATAGYQMTVEELRAAAEALVGTPISADKLVGTLRGFFEGELSEDNLNAVTGGVAGAGPGVSPRVLNINTQQVQGGVSPGPSSFPPPDPGKVKFGGGTL